MNASFNRKVVYGCIIALLWIPLYFIGNPPHLDAKGQIVGGKLADLRRDNDLAQAELGDIDPASESMKLATLGLRGVAVNVLWTMANHYKKVEDFDNFSATVNQITLLQPNFVSVWEFQAHNETYNVSVEYDHYRMRYDWVKKGINLLINGTKYNRKDTRLLNYLSWFFGQKIGRADEHKQFRELFRNDTDFHNDLNKSMDMDDPEILGPASGSAVASGSSKKQPDNWLVGRKWQLRAVNLVETAGVPIRGKSPVLFYSDAPMMRINFCKAIEDEGILGSVAGTSWSAAGKDWLAFGRTQIPTTWGHDILLEDMEKTQEQMLKITDELDDKYAPGVREKILADKRAKLTPQEREAMETPAAKRSNDQLQLAYEAEPKVKVTVDEIANAASPENRRTAKQLARQYLELEDLAGKIDRYRGIVNYAYWRTRCEMEQSPEALAGRQYIFDAGKQGVDLDASKELYDKAWAEWAKAYEKHPEMMTDNEAEDTVQAIKKYKDLLHNMSKGEHLPADFPLFPLLEAQNETELLLGRPSPEDAKTPSATESPMLGEDAKPDAGKTDKTKPAEEKKTEEKQAEDAKPAEEKKPTEDNKAATDEPAAESKPAETPADENKPEEAKPDE